MATSSQEHLVIVKEDFYKKLSEYYSEKPNKKPCSRDEVINIIEEIVIAKSKT